MLKNVFKLLLLTLLFSCTAEQEIKTARIENFELNNEALGDGDLIKIIIPAPDFDKSMYLKTHFHQLVYSIENKDTVNLISPMPFSDTTKTYQFLIESSYAYMLTVDKMLNNLNLGDSSLPQLDLITIPKFPWQNCQSTNR